MDNLRMLSWNVNGIRAIAKKGFIDWFLEESPDILCLQETKAHPDQLNQELTKIEDYHSFFSSAEKKGYSGVAIYSKTKPNNVKNGFGIEKFDSEGRILIAEFDKFVLFNIYYPNGKQSKERLQYKLDFYEAFLECANEYKNQGMGVIFCGDVNTAHKEIDLSRPKSNAKVSGFLPIERAILDKWVENDYLDSFRIYNSEPEHYTWWDYKSRARDRNVGWRIDYFFISNNLENNLSKAFILSDVEGSDHCPIGIEIAF